MDDPRILYWLEYVNYRDFDNKVVNFSLHQILRAEVNKASAVKRM